MAPQKAHIVIPQDLIEEIDETVGPRGRSSFLVEAAWAELRRRKLLAYLTSGEPAWRDEDHPELVALGSQTWVKEMRSTDGDEERLKQLRADDPPHEPGE
jgi:hypothetical protein